MALTSTLDRRAVLGGAATAFIMAAMGVVVALVLGQFLGWDKQSKSLLMTVFLLAGCMLGGFRSGLLYPSAPLSNGAAAAALAYAPLAIIQRVLFGKSINVLSVVFATFIAASFGVFGGLVSNQANQTRRKKR
jgi:putative membrane protein (TIGR04086 family)